MTAKNENPKSNIAARVDANDKKVVDRLLKEGKYKSINVMNHCAFIRVVYDRAARGELELK